jgi:hypothetical protein
LRPESGVIKDHIQGPLKKPDFLPTSNQSLEERKINVAVLVLGRNKNCLIKMNKKIKKKYLKPIPVRYGNPVIRPVSISI